ncbi:MAG: MerR family transcriptional regulator [Acidimicrobiales bacterium]|jgi:DNA-binding transcriptional MerR regulator
MFRVTDGVLAEGFSGKRTAELVGITYRQLDYWARTDLIRPSLADAHGSGSRRRYSYQNLLELKVIKTLLDSGIRLELVREVFSYMRDQLGEDVASANLVISGSSPLLVRSGEEIIDLIHKGQGVLNVLPLAGVKQELDAALVQLFPETQATHGVAADTASTNTASTNTASTEAGGTAAAAVNS